LHRRRAAQKETRCRTGSAVAHDLSAGRELQESGQIARGGVGDVLCVEQRGLRNRIGEALRAAIGRDDDGRQHGRIRQ
jgi:hypothetical protein